MNDFVWLQIISYIGSLIFIFGVGVRALHYSKMPIHLRWDLSPMGFQEDRGRDMSQYETLEWWKKPHEKNLFREACQIGKEIFFFRQVFKRDRGLWYFGYPLHLGFYFYIIWLLLLGFGTIVIPGRVVGPVGLYSPRVFDLLILGTGVAGFVFGTIGSIGLLIKRIVKEDLRLYTHPLDYLNLVFISAFFVSGLWVWWSSNQTFSVARNYFQSLLTLNQVPEMNTATALHILLASAFFAYLPFTTMMHYLAKFFSFHKVRWDDEPNLKGGKLESRLKEILGEEVTWSAPHASPGKTWRELAQGKRNDS